ncbi:MAG TPA: flagellar hook-basal body complex protein FliE [Jatrophihabitans sp.]|jgi:flagellar hook-basal body complex protein FliE
MTIPAISALSAALPTPPTAPTSAAGATGASGATGGSSFASVLGQGLDAVSSAQSKADNLAVKAATGDLTDVHDYTIAATQASLLTELASTLRTKGVDAINQIMGMQA